jgi:hypothetical protein
MTYAEAQRKLKKEIQAAVDDKLPYVMIPVVVAQRLDELCEEIGIKEPEPRG